MYNVVVVGGGAIGLYLSRRFAERGHSVLLLERQQKVGKKPCSGLVSSEIFKFIKKEECNFIENEFLKARLWIEEKFFDFNGRAFLLDRESLDKHLFKEAEKAGVKIRLTTEVTKIREKKSCVEILLGAGETIKGEILAGCDGATSKVAANLALPGQENFLLGIVCYQSEIKRRKQKVVSNFPELFFSKNFQGFFAWRIPRKKHIEWGIALDPKKKPVKKLREFLGRKKVNIEKIESALIPVSPRKKTVTERCFLCGDAAGQVKPSTGGGLIYGLVSAEIASKVINPKSPNTLLYESQWRKKLRKEIFLGDLIKKCYYLPNFLKKIGLLWLKNKKTLHQDRISTIFK